MDLPGFSDSSEINKFITKAYPHIKKENASLIGNISTWSMAPLLRPGMKVKLATTDSSKLKPGDIICFIHKNFVIHRLIKKDKKRLITKGDNKPQADKSIAPEKALGKVAQIILDDEKIINLNSPKSRLVTKLLTWHSILISKLPFLLKIIRGRKLFLRLIYGKSFY